jgi:hypothetical protein
MSSISGVAAVSDVAGMLEDDDHMRTSYRMREVATWLRLPYDEQRKPKRHTTARAHDTAKLGGELWLLRVPADLDLSLLNSASFDDADLDGETPIELAADSARSAVQLDEQVRLVLAARPQEVTLAFKCAFPAVVRVREGDDDDDDNNNNNEGDVRSSGTTRTINHLRFGAPFDRAFSVHRWSAPVSQSTTLNPTYDDKFLDNRARVKPVPREALTHKFLPIGSAATAAAVAATTTTSTSTTATSERLSSHSSSKQSKKEKKKEKKKHRSDNSDDDDGAAAAVTSKSSSHKQQKEKKSKSSKH